MSACTTSTGGGPAAASPLFPRIGSDTLRAASNAVRLASEPPCVASPANSSRLPADQLPQSIHQAHSAAVAHGPMS